MIRKEPLGNGVSVFVSDRHHFTTDTILLADFARASARDRAVDLGSGCGTIPLLWARENCPKEIFAVELQEEAVALLQKSLAENARAGIESMSRITPLHASWSELSGKLPFGAFDLVSCNPPYKRKGSGIENPEPSKKTARHETDGTLDEICAAAAALLQFSGRFCLCQRPERLSDVLQAMRAHDLEPKRLRFVQQRPDKPPKLFLAEGRRGGKPGFLSVLPTLLIEDENGDFSEEMKKIYGSYKEGY